MQINTNMAANNAYRSLSNTQTDLSKSLEKLSSCLRINRAGDDAAGLAISEGLKSQIGGLTVAARNAQDGIGAVQTAEGGLNQTHSILQRLRDLGVQAANDTNSVKSREAIGTEAASLVEELGRIADSTDFNGVKLLNGSVPSISLQVGASSDTSSQIDVKLGAASVSDVKAALVSGGNAVPSATFAIASPAALTGAYTFTTTKAGVETAITTGNLGAAASFTSVEQFASALRADDNFSSKFSVSVEKDANGAGTGIIVKSLDGGTVTPGVAAGTGVAAGVAGATVPLGLDFTSATAARASIDLIDAQITQVSTARADLGATQNRLESAVQTINVAKENLTASNSRIRDTDMAEEMVKFTRNNILSQAGTAMLAQANQSNQGVLQLLR
ncbi:flagellin N-terminal helical domain-containing protein [Pseudarthrobacter sp. ATCC 49987]|uniref:flagellin N-terminal helical domain-containing protein n=1 Tax=Pseudarthrobacter sp. ATCC 49987 TaxID=2698204 RepID=UPI003FCE3C38